jgi:hypothetical protein
VSVTRVCPDSREPCVSRLPPVCVRCAVSFYRYSTADDFAAVVTV